MTTLQQISGDINDAWHHLLDGWRKLYHRAGQALTRYTPGKGGQDEMQDLAVRRTGWGILASEVFDNDDRIVVRLEAPGMDKDDFDLQVVNDFLLVRGEKQMARESSEGGYHISECAYGRFERAIPLPDEVNAGKAKASYKRGVLRVELPKTTPHQRRRIKVNVG